MRWGADGVRAGARERSVASLLTTVPRAYRAIRAVPWRCARGYPVVGERALVLKIDRTILSRVAERAARPSAASRSRSCHRRSDVYRRGGEHCRAPRCGHDLH